MALLNNLTLSNSNLWLKNANLTLTGASKTLYLNTSGTLLERTNSRFNDESRDIALSLPITTSIYPYAGSGAYTRRNIVFENVLTSKAGTRRRGVLLCGKVERTYKSNDENTKNFTLSIPCNEILMNCYAGGGNPNCTIASAQLSCSNYFEEYYDSPQNTVGNYNQTRLEACIGNPNSVTYSSGYVNIPVCVQSDWMNYDSSGTTYYYWLNYMVWVEFYWGSND